MTYRQLAARTGLPVDYLYHIGCGSRLASPKRAQLIEDATGGEVSRESLVFRPVAAA